MVAYYYYGAGLIMYIMAVFMMYYPGIKTSSWYLPANIAMGIVGSYLWGMVVKTSGSDADLYLKGILWDAMLIMCFTFIPPMFGVTLKGIEAIGAAIIVIGVLVVKFGPYFQKLLGD